MPKRKNNVQQDRDEWLTEFEFVELLEAERGNRPLRDFAGELGVSNTFLGAVLNRQKPIGGKIPDAMGYEAVTLYRRIETDQKKAG